jgi:hypothetical protein
MAPEQAAGLNHLAGPAWDVWALGVMLHELLTGQPPRSSAAPERLLRPTEPDNPPPTKIRPTLDPRLSAIVRRCLARDPADRYPDGAAVAADLRGWLNRGQRFGIGLAAGILALFITGTAVGAVLLSDDPDARTDAPAADAVPAEPTPAGAAVAVPPAPDRDQVLAQFQRRLKARNEVAVIGATGMPVWSDVVVGSDVVKPYVSDVDGALTLDSSQMILMEMPPTGLDRYRFEVDVLQRTDNRAARFGAYAGRQRRATKTGETVDCFAALWFNDVAHGTVPDVEGAWTFGLRPYYRRQVGAGGQGGVSGGVEFGAHARYAPKEGGPAARWHTLAVEVTPDRMTWFFDGQPTGALALPLTDAIHRQFARTAALPAGVRADPTPDGGYGLLVFQGPAGFRNARVRPLDP